jgi:signal transduction histidine kinase
MMDDVQRLDALFDHLLTVARLDHVERSEQLEEVPIDELLKSCADEVRRRYDLEPDQIKLEMTPAVVRGLTRDLEMVFLNLLDNAVRYGAERPLVIVQLNIERGKRAITRISDNGKGVSFDLRRKIFHRFYRGGSELERTTKGTGLGLHIVRSLLKKMKGKIHVHGRGPYGGATFEVDLPALAPAPAPSQPVPSLVS